MILPKKSSYQQFLDKVLMNPAINMRKEAQAFIDRFRDAHTNHSRYGPVLFMLDYTTRKYVYVDESCYNLLGYTAAYFIETGLENYLEKWHPGDLQVISTDVFRANLEFLQHIPASEYPDHIVSYNYRCKNADGHFMQILQRSSFIPSNLPGKPYGIIGIVVDISHFKQDNSIVHTIEKKVQKGHSFVTELLLKKTYPVPEDNGKFVLSKRELEILKHIASGHSSKQIAVDMGVSIHTIHNHRKNMMKKTGAKTSSELIKFGAINGLL